MEEKLDKIAESLTEMRVDIAEIRKDLNYHIRRTDLAEQQIEKLANEIKPIQEHVAFIRISGKLLGALGGLAAVAASIYQLIGGK